MLEPTLQPLPPVYETLRDEWKESRVTIDRFDKISIDLRKYGFSLVTLIITGTSIVFNAAQVTNPLPLVIVPIAIFILLLGLFFADSYYQVLLLAAILHSRQLENVHKEVVNSLGVGNFYFGLNLTNFLEDKVQKSKAYTYTIAIYFLFLFTGFILGHFSLVSYELSSVHPMSVLSNIIILFVAFLIAILMITFVSLNTFRLIREVQETELIDNRFVIKKVYDIRQIADTTKQLSDRIFRDYKERKFKLLTLGMGGLYFANNVIGYLKKKGLVNVELITAFSERNGDEVQIEAPNTSDVEGESILIVDDLISTGLTVQKAVELCRELKAESVRVCALIDANKKRRPSARSLKVDYVGIKSDEKQHFFVGAGLDGGSKMSEEARNKCRLLPYIGIIVSPLDDGKN